MDTNDIGLDESKGRTTVGRRLLSIFAFCSCTVLSLGQCGLRLSSNNHDIGYINDTLSFADRRQRTVASN